jgi:hypothetical protein
MSDERDDESDESPYVWTGDGMRAAHRVVEEHLRARRQYDPRGGQSPFGYRYPGMRGDGAIDQMMRVYLDLMNCVFSMISAGPLGRPQPYNGDYYPNPELHRHDRVTRVSIQTNYTRAKGTPGIPFTGSITTTLDLEAPRHARLAVLPLVTLDSAIPSIDDVQIHLRNHRPVLETNIPEDQPEGTYTGAIVDANTDEEYGKLTVRIEVYV